jgi:hypothetical protein
MSETGAILRHGDEGFTLYESLPQQYGSHFLLVIVYWNCVIDG